MTLPECRQLLPGDKVVHRGCYGGGKVVTWIGPLLKQGSVWRGIVERADGRRLAMPVSTLVRRAEG